jgi:hypothetical protein
MSQCSFTHNALQQLQLCLPPHMQRNKSSINPSSSTSSSYSPPLPTTTTTNTIFTRHRMLALAHLPRPHSINGGTQCEAIAPLRQSPRLRRVRPPHQPVSVFEKIRKISRNDKMGRLPASYQTHSLSQRAVPLTGLRARLPMSCCAPGLAVFLRHL